MERLHLPDNVKVHFASFENTARANCAVKVGINYALYSAFPFIFKRIYKKKAWPEFNLKWIDNPAIQVPRYLNMNFRHVIQDSGLFSLLFGSNKHLAGEDIVYKWYDELVQFTQEHNQDVAVVEVDAQSIIGVEETWRLREQMRKDLPNNRIINVFHFEDGMEGLDRLIEYSDYIAIGSGVVEYQGLFTKPICEYIKNKKPEIDIHLLGVTRASVISKIKHLCTSCDSVTWTNAMRFGELGNGNRSDWLDTEKVKSFFGDRVWNNVREALGEKEARSVLVALENKKRQYTKAVGSQD